MLRLFIAIELPAALKQALIDLQDDLKRQLPPKAVRWTRPEGIHLTLKFLGDTPSDRVDAVAAAMSQAAAGFAPFSLQVAGLGCFPNLRRPRVIWTGLPDPPRSLAGLQRATDLHLARLGWERDKRAFNPHLTLGRVNDRVSGAERQAIAELLGRAEVGTLGVVPVSEVILFQSDLLSSGAVYTTLRGAALTR